MSKATKIDLFNFTTPAMRAFHVTWFAFFVCFFGWFGIAPLMPYVREDLGLTKVQIGNTIIASVAATIFARLIIGWLCDRIGPRRVYTWLLSLGAIPVMSLGLCNSYESFLLVRLAVGMIGASFVVTQFHTSRMFAPTVVGTANATTAGWGNMGGGVTQIVMPLVATGLLGVGFLPKESWRLAMILPGLLMLAAAYFYHRFTQDTPEGNFADLDREASGSKPKGLGLAPFREALTDIRVWTLLVGYGACFGIEITIHNVAALYFVDEFFLSPGQAGLIAGSFGVLAIFARSLGGYCGDLAGRRHGLQGRSLLLGGVLLLEGGALILFSQATVLPLAVLSLLVFGLFIHMSAGATYSVVPFINPNGVGAVAGIVGAGGNLGAVLAGLLFRDELLKPQTAFLYLGSLVVGVSVVTLLVRFAPARSVTAVEGVAIGVAAAPAE